MNNSAPLIPGNSFLHSAGTAHGRDAKRGRDRPNAATEPKKTRIAEDAALVTVASVVASVEDAPTFADGQRVVDALRWSLMTGAITASTATSVADTLNDLGSRLKQQEEQQRSAFAAAAANRPTVVVPRT